MIAEGVTKNQAAEVIYDSLSGGDRKIVIAAIMEGAGMTQEEATKRHFYERRKPRRYASGRSCPRKRLRRGRQARLISALLKAMFAMQRASSDLEFR